MPRRAAYVAATDRHLLMFANALRPLGYARVVHFPTLDSALSALSAHDDYRLIILHSPVPGAPAGGRLFPRARRTTTAPVLALDWDGPAPDPRFGKIEVLPTPVTAATIAERAARLRSSDRSGLVARLKKAPGFDTFSEDALAFLLSHARAIQVEKGQLLFDYGDPGDRMYFVIAGSLSIRIGDREVERVRVGSFFGEMAMIEGKPRSAAAVSAEPCVLLEIGREALGEADSDFRSVLFEYLTRTLIRRLRRSDELIARLDGFTPQPKPPAA